LEKNLERVFVDVSSIYFIGKQGGIPRVVRKLVESLHRQEGLEVTCFVFAGGRFYSVSSDRLEKPRPLSQFVKRLRELSGIRNYPGLPLYDIGISLWQALCTAIIWASALSGGARAIPSFDKSDTILLPYVLQRRSSARAMRKYNRGALTVGLIHDLLPIRHPHLFSAELGNIFSRGLDDQIALADILIGVSLATADSVVRYLKERGIPKPVSHVYLGCDFLGPAPTQRESPVWGAAQSPAPLALLSVGTLEPRKNYEFALSLCERLWAHGHDFRYVIVGRHGWKWRDLVARIERHPEFGRRLFLHTAMDDQGLSALYRDSDFLLATSIDEGFGLPLMEAQQNGLRVICSDIPVFRELCESAQFIPPDDVDAAATRITATLRDWKRVRPAPAPMRSAPRGLLSWRESASRLRAEISNARGTPAERPVALLLAGE